MSHPLPPIGIIPLKYALESRLRELGEAIDRYKEYIVEFPIDVFEKERCQNLINEWKKEISFIYAILDATEYTDMEVLRGLLTPYGDGY